MDTVSRYHTCRLHSQINEALSGCNHFPGSGFLQSKKVKQVFQSSTFHSKSVAQWHSFQNSESRQCSQRVMVLALHPGRLLEEVPYVSTKPSDPTAAEFSTHKDRCIHCLDNSNKMERLCSAKLNGLRKWQENSFCNSQTLPDQKLFANCCYSKEQKNFHQPFVPDKGFSHAEKIGFTVSLEVPELTPAPYGWMYLGVCGNALITRAGKDGRCFHEEGFSCERDEAHEQMKASYILYAPLEARAVLKVPTLEPVDVGSGCVLKSSTTKEHQPNKVRKRFPGRKKKPGKTATSTRDLYGRSSFHFFEVIFNPFIGTTSLASNLQGLSKESLEELAGMLNQLAIGLAGSGVTVMLFVVSRLLSINATFDYNKVIRIGFGIGLILISVAMKRVAEVMNQMVDARTRFTKKELLIRLQAALQCLASSALPMLSVCLVNFC